MSIEPDATTAVELLGWRILGPAEAGALLALGFLALRTSRRRRTPAALTPIQSSE